MFNGNCISVDCFFIPFLFNCHFNNYEIHRPHHRSLLSSTLVRAGDFQLTTPKNRGDEWCP